MCESLRLQGQRRRRGRKLGHLALLNCTDQSDFHICLANEMMTYGGNMNSFDEASFLMQSSGFGGRCVSVCLCRSCCQLARCYFSSSLRLAEILCVCGYMHRIRVSFWINSVDPFKRSCTWFILSLWGKQRSPHSGTLFPGVFPFPPAGPDTHAPHIYCITHMIDIHHTSATVYPSMQPAAKSRIQSFMVNLQVISILGMIIFMSCQWWCWI